MSVSKRRKLWLLFSSMLYISAFTFGGGFVIVTLMKKRFVDELGWIDDQEMLDMTALAQSSPGAIAVNAAILVGWKTAGFAGMLAAVCGTILPPLVILSVISLAYDRFAGNRYVEPILRGMQSGVAAVILDVSLKLGQKVVKTHDRIHLIMMAAVFAATFFFRINVIWMILCAAVIGVIRTFTGRKAGDPA